MIEGFNEENIEKCSEKYLGSKEKRSVMLKQAEEAGIYKNKSEFNGSPSLLRVPIVFLMIFVIFEEGNYLPKARTETGRQIIELNIERITLKLFSEGMYEDIKGLQEAPLCALLEESTGR